MGLATSGTGVPCGSSIVRFQDEAMGGVHLVVMLEPVALVALWHFATETRGVELFAWHFGWHFGTNSQKGHMGESANVPSVVPRDFFRKPLVSLGSVKSDSCAMGFSVPAIWSSGLVLPASAAFHVSTRSIASWWCALKIQVHRLSGSPLPW